MLGRPTGNTSPVGLLERWDARNQKILERQNRTSIEWWAKATERPPPRWLLVVGSVYVGGGVIGLVVGLVRRDIEQAAMGAVNVLVFGMPIALVYLLRRHHW